MVADSRMTIDALTASQQAEPIPDTPYPAETYTLSLATTGAADETSRTVSIYQSGTLYPGRAARWTWEDSDSVRGWWPQWQQIGRAHV